MSPSNQSVPPNPPCAEATPCVVASSSRPPAAASGGQEKGPPSPHKPWVEAGEEKGYRALGTILVRVQAGPSDILHHAVGEMPGRVEGVFCQRGFVGTVDRGYRRPPASSRAPRVPPSEL